jgi:hypothetical protein
MDESEVAPVLEPAVVARQWLKGLRLAHTAHSRCAAKYERMSYWLGAPAVGFSAIVGSAVFTSLAATDSPPLFVGIGIGLLSIAASVLAALQTFLDYPRKAQNHRQAAASYGIVRRAFEQALTEAKDDKSVGAALNRCRPMWEKVDADAPSLIGKVHDQVLGQLKTPTQ